MATPEPTPPPTLPPQQAPGNGMAVAGFVLGLVGVLLGLTALTAIFGIICGVLGIVFGALGRGRASKQAAPYGGLALAGLILGIAAVLLSFASCAIFANELDKLTRS